MEDNYKTLIDSTEFQEKILDYVGSDEIDKIIDSSVFKDNPECKKAVIYGMTIAAMLVSRCKKIYATDGTHEIQLLKKILKDTDGCSLCKNNIRIGGGYWDCSLEPEEECTYDKYQIDWEAVFKEYGLEV